MALDRKQVFEKAKEVTKKHKLFWIEDICSIIPISKPTFYEFFPIDSNEINELKGMLDQNRMELKVSMRKKWHESNAPALQVALMKLLANQEELKRLSVTYNENTNQNTEAPKEITYRIIND